MQSPPYASGGTTLRAEALAVKMNLHQALRHFAEFNGPTQSQEHIRPLHAYVARRLVVEGGFHPEDIKPRPPFDVARGNRLVHEPRSASRGEATILGGLKTKNIDIVVFKEGIGPVLAVSCKGMTGAVRNLTNRLEETIGECTNIHIAYPGLVFGYLFVLRANQAEFGAAPTDIAIDQRGMPVEAVIRFHSALSAMSGRQGIRDDLSRYEAIAMMMVEMAERRIGSLLDGFPPTDSHVQHGRFFETLYRHYDERYVVGAPKLASRTRRKIWSRESPAFADEALTPMGYEPRVDVDL